MSMPPALDAMATGQPGGAVDHEAEVQFAPDLHRFFDEDPLHPLSFRAGLVRDQHHAQHLAGDLRGLLRGPCQLDAAAFPAPAGMDLRLDDDAFCALVQTAASRPDSASSRVKAISPRGTATPYFARIVFA